MPATAKSDERRQSNRYKLFNRAITVSQEGVGHLIEMSYNGFSAKYIDCDFPPEKRWNTNLIISGSNLYIGKVQVKVVWSDSKVTPPYSSVSTQKIGVQFTSLTKYQKSKIARFIECHTEAKRTAMSFS